jgi:hypothetical protein
MSWVDILKKNEKDFEVNIEKDIEYKDTPNIIYDPNITDLDEEFDKLYSLKIYDIKFDFKQFIEESSLPFLNLKSTNNLFIDFIKYNSTNYYNLEKKVNEENDKYLLELLEEEEQEKYDYSLEND